MGTAKGQLEAVRHFRPSLSPDQLRHRKPAADLDQLLKAEMHELVRLPPQMQRLAQDPCETSMETRS